MRYHRTHVRQRLPTGPPWPTLLRLVPLTEHQARLVQAERAITEHPAHTAYLDCRVIETSIAAVFIPNWQELLALLDRAASDEDLAIELIQNMYAPVVREQYHAALTQRLHNYLASTSSLIDHVHGVMNDRTGKLRSEFERRKSALTRTHPEILFVRDLRNFMLHRTLPFVGHSLRFVDINTPQQRFISEVELSVHELQEWSGWKAAARQFLSRQGDALALRPIIRVHGELMQSLNAWLHTQLVLENAEGINALNRLIVHRNAVLSGSELSAAERQTAQVTLQRSLPRPAKHGNDSHASTASPPPST
jgi:hypothetical protein